MANALRNGKSFFSSRCGDIEATKDFLLKMQAENSPLLDNLTNIIISKRDRLENISQIFEDAKNHENIKIIVDVKGSNREKAE